MSEKGQSSMMVIAVAILMLVFIMFFIFSQSLGSFGGESLKTEYRNLYAHSALLSILRTDTECGVFSDVLKSAYFGGGKCDSDGFLRGRLPVFMKAVLNATGNTNFDWLLVAEPKNFDGTVMEVGNSEILGFSDRWDARTILTWEGYQLEVKIYFRTK